MVGITAINQLHNDLLWLALALGVAIGMLHDIIKLLRKRSGKP